MFKFKSLAPLAIAAAAFTSLAHADGEAKNVIFFLGDGMGPADVTASRIYKYGEAGFLTMETLTHTMKIRTYSRDAQTTDSAPSMAAYMTGVKMNNEVLSMSAPTSAYDASGKPYVNGADSTCPAKGNGRPATTLLELAKAAGKSVGAVTTTRVTHATPAATYAHICHRDGENAIAAQAVPGGAGYNSALGSGLNVLMGGGRTHFLPNTSGGKRTDGRNLIAELQAQGYTVAQNHADFDAIPANASKVVGLFNSSHLNYDLDRQASSSIQANEPSLAEMTAKAIDLLSSNQNGYFLMVEGGRIDHALHSTNAARALGDTVAFDDAIGVALSKVDLSNTLIVVTADHDHTMIMNGYAKRTGPTSASNPGVLGLVRNVVTGNFDTDAEGMPYSVLGFGNGESRVAGARNSVAALDETTTANINYHQEAAVKVGAGSETHGSGDVMLMAIGGGAADESAARFRGIEKNTSVFFKLRRAMGL